MLLKIYLVLLAFLLTVMPTALANYQPIIWSDSIKKNEKPVTEIINLSDHMILKSDRTLSINLNDKLPITSIELRPDLNPSQHMSKKAFLFNIRLSDNVSKVIDIPFGETKF